MKLHIRGGYSPSTPSVLESESGRIVFTWAVWDWLGWPGSPWSEDPKKPLIETAETGGTRPILPRGSGPYGSGDPMLTIRLGAHQTRRSVTAPIHKKELRQLALEAQEREAGALGDLNTI